MLMGAVQTKRAETLVHDQINCFLLSVLFKSMNQSAEIH